MSIRVLTGTKLPVRANVSSLYHCSYLISSACIILNQMKNIFKTTSGRGFKSICRMFVNTQLDVSIFKNWPALDLETSGWGSEIYGIRSGVIETFGVVIHLARINLCDFCDQACFCLYGISK